MCAAQKPKAGRLGAGAPRRRWDEIPKKTHRRKKAGDVRSPPAWRTAPAGELRHDQIVDGLQELAAMRSKMEELLAAEMMSEARLDELAGFVRDDV